MIRRYSCFRHSLSSRGSEFLKVLRAYRWLILLGGLTLGLVPLNGGAKIVSQENLAHLPPGRPAIVYVQDFKVEKESSSDQQSLGGGRARAMIARVKGATGMQSSKVVDQMSSSLVSDLNRGGVKAVRLPTGQTLPKSGWLVRGVFTEVDQGSRALRAEVGFGAGSTDLAVLVNVADLQKGKAKPFYKLETQAASKKMPGGASMAIVTKNPYVAAAKFVMSRRDLSKNIRQTAQTIADQIISRAGRG
jgi:hypothetical protein